MRTMMPQKTEAEFDAEMEAFDAAHDADLPYCVTVSSLQLFQNDGTELADEVVEWLNATGNRWAECNGFVRFASLLAAERFHRSYGGFLMVPRDLHIICPPSLKPSLLEGSAIDRALDLAYRRREV